MPQTQFGHTLFLNGFEPNSVAERLERLHFSKTASESAPYDEAWLQLLVMRHPSLLPVDQIEPAFQTMVPICIELPMQSGYMDNLLVTPAGDLALIECKLWRNPEARREVLAQIIDYAKEIATWNYEQLQDAISRAKAPDGSKEKITRCLYELVAAKGEIDEAAFHDAVSRNLKRGRFLLLIVGDGIREGVESMAEFLQQHAGFHFTLAFVEIAVFKAPNGYVAQPRVLARTRNIDRGIVTLNDGRITISAPVATSAAAEGTARRTTITQERYLEQLEKDLPGISQKLNAFLDGLTTCNVFPEFGAESLILRWSPDTGRAWNLGTISKHGVVWLDYLGQQANSAGVPELHKKYLGKLASLVPGAYVKETAKQSAWYVAKNDKYVTVDALVADQATRDGWMQAIADFQAAVNKLSNGD
jgi:hypothetical protein